MESFGAIGDGEWSSFNAIYSSSTEEADFMAQLLGNCSLPNDQPNNSNIEFSTTYWPESEPVLNMAVVEESPINSSDGTSANMYHSLWQCSHPQHIYYPSSSNLHPILMKNDSSVSTNYDMASDHHMYTDNCQTEEGDVFLNQDLSSDSMESGGNLQPEAVPRGMNLQLKEHRLNFVAAEKSQEDETDNFSETSKKRTRIPLDVQKNNRLVKAKKNDEKLNSTDINFAEGGHPVLQRQSSSSCLSEDDSNACHEFNGGALLLALPSSSNSKGASKALNLNGKTRASRGSATDPQSLYARKRREKINERLRILQNLVPNGTKVDISTMLEEAVQYVKFLQLQIKLLSSDDLWMYAPIAYNGMNLGLDLNIDATLKS